MLLNYATTDIKVRCRRFPGVSNTFFVSLVEQPDGSTVALCNTCDSADNTEPCIICWMNVRAKLESDPSLREV